MMKDLEFLKIIDISIPKRSDFNNYDKEITQGLVIEKLFNFHTETV